MADSNSCIVSLQTVLGAARSCRDCNNTSSCICEGSSMQAILIASAVRSSMLVERPINAKHCAINFSAFMHGPVTFPRFASPIAAYRAAIL